MTAAYDEIADWYEQEFLARTAGTDALGIQRALRGLLGPGRGVCLEIGCGTGVHAAGVRELGWTAVGIDLSGAMLRYARGRLPVARADAGRLPVRDGCVPAVIVVMAHTDMPCYPAVLREAARVLRPGGVLVHVGVHPCFCGGFADRRDPSAVVIRPGYLDGHWTRASWTDQGVRDKVGAAHLPLPGLLQAFLDAGLTFEQFTEGAEPTPVVLAIRARKPQLVAASIIGLDHLGIRALNSQNYLFRKTVRLLWIPLAMIQCYTRIVRPCRRGLSPRRYKLIDVLALALLKGIAGGLGERLIKSPKDRVAIKSLTNEVKGLRIAQEETQLTTAELMKVFENIASNTDGLTVSRSKIGFQATEKTPTLGDALMNLDQEIEVMRSAAAKAESLKSEAEHLDPARDAERAQGVEPAPESHPAQSASALSGLDYEISALRGRDANE